MATRLAFATALGIGISLVSPAAAEVHMRILSGSKLLGYATVSQWVVAGGGKTVEMRMELGTATGKTTKLHKVSNYDPKGRPSRMVLEIESNSRNETICTFDASGAHVSKIVNGVAKTSAVDRAANAPWGDGSEFWFLRNRPKVGEKERTLLFLIDKSEWVLTDISYLGIQEITVGNERQKLHAVRSESDGRASTAFLDSRGDPVKVELEGGVTMERISPAPKKSGANG